MGEFPRLQPNGLIEWPSVDAMYAQWPNTLGRGALVVRPGRSLAPLEILDVVVDVPGEASRTCKAEVVRLEPERAMLRLLDGPLPPLPPPPSPPPVPPPQHLHAINLLETLTPLPHEMPPPDLVPRLPVREPSGPVLRAILTPVVEVVAEYDPLPASSPSASPPVLLPTTTILLPLSALPAPSGTWPTPGPAAERPTGHATPPAPSLDTRPASVRFPSGRLAGDPDPFAAAPVAPTADLTVRPASSQSVPVAVVVTPSTKMPTTTTTTTTIPAPSIPVTASAIGSLRAAVAPTVSGSVLRFGNPTELQAARSDMLTLGAVLAVGDLGATSIELAIAIGGLETKARVKVSLSTAAPGTLVVQARRDQWKPLLDEIDNALVAQLAQRSRGVPAAASVDTNISGVPAVALQLSPAGTLTNPVTPRGIMMLPLQRPLNKADLKTPSVPLFLRWLRTTRGVFRVELVATQEQQSVTFIVVDGREIRSAVAAGTLGKILAGHVYTYTMTELPRAPTTGGSVRTLHLMVEVLRGLLAEHPVDDIAAAFPHTRDLRLVRAVAAVADALGLSGPAARVVKSSLQGDDTVAGVVAGAAAPRVTWETLVLLELFAGLTLAVGEPVRAPPLAAPSVANTDTFDGKDHYAVLGLHWSCPPSAISAAHNKARREYGPQGSRRPADDVLAHKALKRIDEAFSVLGNTDKRHAYRTATYNLAWNQQAQLLVQQAKAAVYRKEVAEARDLLAAAIDLAPTPEAVVLFESLKAL